MACRLESELNVSTLAFAGSPLQAVAAQQEDACAADLGVIRVLIGHKSVSINFGNQL